MKRYWFIFVLLCLLWNCDDIVQPLDFDSGQPEVGVSEDLRFEGLWRGYTSGCGTVYLDFDSTDRFWWGSVLDNGCGLWEYAWRVRDTSTLWTRFLGMYTIGDWKIENYRFVGSGTLELGRAGEARVSYTKISD